LGADKATLKGILNMTGAALALAVMSAMFKVAGDRLPVFELVFFRGLVGYLLLVSIERLRHEPVRKAHDHRGLFLRSIFGFLSLVLYVVTIEHVGLGLASALNQSSPVFVVVLSFSLLGERPRPVLLLLVLAAFGGVWLIASPDLSGVNAYALGGAASALLAALAYSMVRRLRRTDSAWVIVRTFTLWSAIFSVPCFFWSGFLWPTPHEWGALVAVGVLGLAGQLLMTNAYQVAEASTVAPFLYVCPLASLAMGWAFWGEWPEQLALVGCAILLVSSLLIAVVTARASPSTKP
jgi:drug/metabolite transporter (DMT)-like permease